MKTENEFKRAARRVAESICWNLKEWLGTQDGYTTGREGNCISVYTRVGHMSVAIFTKPELEMLLTLLDEDIDAEERRLVRHILEGNYDLTEWLKTH